MFRFSATVRDLTADAHMMFDLSDIRGLDFPTRWYATYAGLAPEHVRWRKITFSGFDSPLLRVLNLKYVFAATGRVPLAAEHVAQVYPGARGQLWEVRDPQPRSFMVYDAVVAGPVEGTRPRDLHRGWDDSAVKPAEDGTTRQSNRPRTRRLGSQTGRGPDDSAVGVSR